MSCGCENRKRMQDLAKVHEQTKKAARMEGRVYVLNEKAERRVWVRGRGGV